jgi:hypothetical protein
MGPFHHITIFLISEQEKSEFLKLGVELSEVTRWPCGECAVFEIAESDARWANVAVLIDSLEAREGIPKKYRVQNLSMEVPLSELKRRREEALRNPPSITKPNGKWLKGYSGQSVEELLLQEGEYRIDSLVLAFEEAILQKAEREGEHNLTEEENIVLAVEALEREVNNGGYHQFFINSSQEFVPTVVSALKRIGCMKTATITQQAIKALDVTHLTLEAIEAAMAEEDEDRLTKLNRCDDSYYESAEPIAERLFAFIKANKATVKF